LSLKSPRRDFPLSPSLARGVRPAPVRHPFPQHHARLFVSNASGTCAPSHSANAKTTGRRRRSFVMACVPRSFLRTFCQPVSPAIDLAGSQRARSSFAPHGSSSGVRARQPADFSPDLRSHGSAPSYGHRAPPRPICPTDTGGGPPSFWFGLGWGRECSFTVIVCASV